jgi:hypothetical protein
MDFGSGLTVFFGLSLLAPLALLGLIVLAVVAVAGGREPDPSGARQRAVYLSAISFVAIMVMLLAGFAAVASLTELIGHDSVRSIGASTTVRGSSSSSSSIGGFSTSGDEGGTIEGSFSETEDDNNSEHAVSGAVASLLVLAAAGAVLFWHRPRFRALIDGPGLPSGPVRRAVQGYYYSVCFVTALIAIGAGAVALYGLYRIFAPGLSNPGVDQGDERESGLRTLFSFGALTAGAVYLFLMHMRRPEEWDAAEAIATGTPPPPPPPPPPPVETELEPVPVRRPRPRKRAGAGSEEDMGPVA